MANGLGMARREPPPPPRRGPYNQDEEVRRFQEARKAEERERIRREQEALEQRRRGYRPEDPQMGPDKRPYWPYDRPYVGPRVTAETIRVMDNVPGVNRITGPAIMVADGISGKTPAPGEGPMPSRPRMPSGYRSHRFEPRQGPPSGASPRQAQDIIGQNSSYHKKQSDFWSEQEEIAYRRGDTQGRAEAIRARNWHDNQYVRWEEEKKKIGMRPRGDTGGRQGGSAAPLEADFQAASRRRLELQKRVRLLEQQAARSKDPRAQHMLRNALQEYEKANEDWKVAGERLRRSRQGG